MFKGKHVPKFTVIVNVVILFLFFAFWSFRFGIFTPVWGTSGASISALWGQFLVGLFATLAVCTILFIADLRNKPTQFYKLASLYFLVIAAILVGWLVWKDKADYGKTHTYALGQEFSYLVYNFTTSATVSDIPLKDCSGLSDRPYGSGRLFSASSDKSRCESGNSYVAGKRQLSMTVKVRNNTDSFKFFTPDWFQLTSNVGKTYKIRFSDSKGLYQVPPNSEITASLTTADYIGSGETIYSIKLQIDNHAEQIIR